MDGVLAVPGGPLAYKLSVVEARCIETLAALRQSENLLRPNARELKVDGRDENAIGAYGEYVASLLLDVCWRPVVPNPWVEGHKDIGRPHHRLQVRTKSVVGYKDLLLHDDDSDDDRFVSVEKLGTLEFGLTGWMYGVEGKKKEFWVKKGEHNMRYGCYLAPHTLLHPIEELRAILKEER